VSESHSIKTALAFAQNTLGASAESTALETEILLAYCLQCSRAHLRTWPEKLIPKEQFECYEKLLQRRSKGEPIAYITETREFWGLPLRVTNETLIPRPETEQLVELAIEQIPTDQAWSIADLGTGCGAIGLAIGKERPNCQIMATDISASAIEIAKQNAQQLNITNVSFNQGDWFEACAGQRFDVIVSNPPYVAAGDPHLQQGDLRFEPIIALKANDDGIAELKTIIETSILYLAPGGWLFVEHGYDQGEAVGELFNNSGFDQVTCHADFASRDRITLGQLHMRTI
jgi:release factor glutamine methyltransferase